LVEDLFVSQTFLVAGERELGKICLIAIFGETLCHSLFGQFVPQKLHASLNRSAESS
jgi:hypothetical protein